MPIDVQPRRRSTVLMIEFDNQLRAAAAALELLDSIPISNGGHKTVKTNCI